MNKEQFTEYLLTGKVPPEQVQEGGYLIPPTFTVKRRGLIGKICRFFNISYGWKECKNPLL